MGNVAVEICLSPLLPYLKVRLSHAEVKPAQAPPQSKGSITSFFNGTSKAMKSMVECPVCSAKVEEGKINKHMDGPECKLEDSDVEILGESNKETPKLCENQCPETKEMQ